MISRIKYVLPIDNFILYVHFDDEQKVMYDMKYDIQQISDFKVLLTEKKLFENVQLDTSRTCVYWNDRIDLPSDILMEYGTPVE